MADPAGLLPRTSLGPGSRGRVRPGRARARVGYKASGFERMLNDIPFDESEANVRFFKRSRGEAPERHESGDEAWHAARASEELRALGYTAEADASEAIYIQEGWIGTTELFPRLGIDLGDYLQRSDEVLGDDNAAELMGSPKVHELQERLFDARHLHTKSSQ
jgi:hypothetical protein